MTAKSSVVILGLARQGKALARFFAAQGWRVTVSDMHEPAALQDAMHELSDLPLHYALGGHPLSLLDECDLFCTSGGVPTDLPIVQEAARRGIPLSNDAQEFMIRCPAPIVGITGSAGKTTTTTWVGKMLTEAGFTTWVGGNIGNPLISDLASIRPTDRVVMELSSFQLELMHVSPSIAGVLNITPNHLDRHKTMEAYSAAKANIVTHQHADDIAVLGYDEPRARGLATMTPAQIRYFSGTVEVDEGAFLQGATLVLRRQGRQSAVCERSDLHVRGYHNVMNALAAITLADAAGAPPAAMRRAIATFTGVEHRLEVVRCKDGVLWVNDSIATAPERVLAALHAFDEPLILLAGGRDKNLPWQEFAQIAVQRVRVIILFGEAAALIHGHIETALAGADQERVVLEEVVAAGTLENAVHEAARRARPGDVVLLSPGGTSFDAFRDFAARGDRFREWVAAL
ncbi:MAG TPA: UDP-N-acetylmuramoyl-L-alanine--D-glutamate ligase [Anaerolineae bacterium]|nr:UDP-N-acetylmuramoyl-L-alanine--D-glutamate ligase [Anaerolineae bacterium]HQH38633.1 UDP-N-acetylmuramoyl-L-alanine--D-glutamate ligase [Anaerolineae bacterium]